jgi:hypothetical protein
MMMFTASSAFMCRSADRWFRINLSRATLPLETCAITSLIFPRCLARELSLRGWEHAGHAAGGQIRCVLLWQPCISCRISSAQHRVRSRILKQSTRLDSSCLATPECIVSYHCPSCLDCAAPDARWRRMDPGHSAARSRVMRAHVLPHARPSSDERCRHRIPSDTRS